MQAALAQPSSPGEYLRIHRESIIDKTQGQVAAKLKVKQQFVSAMERGEAPIPLDRLADIVKAYAGIDAKTLEKLIFQSRGALLTKEEEFADDFWRSISESQGTVFVLSGKSLPFGGERIAELGQSFLKNPKNRIRFLTLDRFEQCAEFYSTASDLDQRHKRLLRDSWTLTHLQDLCSVYRRLVPSDQAKPGQVEFFSVTSLDALAGGTAGSPLLVKFLPLLHPLTATTIFQSDSQPPVRVGYLFVRSSDVREKEGHFVWVRLSEDVLTALSALIEAVFEASQTLKFLCNDTHYAI
jgi:transcriptional regulator with XRE-family HTH domain